MISIFNIEDYILIGMRYSHINKKGIRLCIKSDSFFGDHPQSIDLSIPTLLCIIFVDFKGYRRKLPFFYIDFFISSNTIIIIGFKNILFSSQIDCKMMYKWDILWAVWRSTAFESDKMVWGAEKRQMIMECELIIMESKILEGEIFMSIRVTIWNEYRHEREEPEIAAVYPEGIHAAIAAHLGQDAEFEIKTATLDEPSHGLTDEVLDHTDVLIWWGHRAHAEVSDEIVKKVHERVLCGMGLIALHSAHYSKIFKALMGTTCSLLWREVGERERIWVVEPNHPIAEGIDSYFELEHEEMYGERFDIPAPDELVFLSWFKGGEVFRSGCCYKRGYGRVFYFQPGHESYPNFHNENVIKIIKNAVKWAAPRMKVSEIKAINSEPIEKI